MYSECLFAAKVPVEDHSITLTTEAEVNAEIGRRVRAARQAAGVTQVALATHLGFSSQQLAKYESGTNRLSVRILLEITKFLHIGIAELFPPFDGTEVVVDPDLARSFECIDPAVRRRINPLVDALVESDNRPRRYANIRS